MQPLPADIAIRHLARVVESSDDAIVSKDLNGVITSWNRAAERMFGYTAEEVVGTSIRLIIPADRQSEEEVILDAHPCWTARDSVRDDSSAEGRHADPDFLTVSPIFDDAGRVIGASRSHATSPSGRRAPSPPGGWRRSSNARMTPSSRRA